LTTLSGGDERHAGQGLDEALDEGQFPSLFRDGRLRSGVTGNAVRALREAELKVLA